MVDCPWSRPNSALTQRSRVWVDKLINASKLIWHSQQQQGAWNHWLCEVKEHQGKVTKSTVVSSVFLRIMFRIQMQKKGKKHPHESLFHSALVPAETLYLRKHLIKRNWSQVNCKLSLVVRGHNVRIGHSLLRQPYCGVLEKRSVPGIQVHQFPAETLVYVIGLVVKMT